MPGTISSLTINVTRTDGISVVLLNHDTNEVIEFPYFVLVSFAEGGDYVSNHCTLPQLAEGLLKLHDLYDKLMEEAQVKAKPRLHLLPPSAKKD